MPERESKSHLEEDICIHIFTVSAALVGVCLTVIGIIRIVISIHKINTLADDLLAIDAFLFLCACEPLRLCPCLQKLIIAYKMLR